MYFFRQDIFNVRHRLLITAAVALSLLAFIALLWTYVTQPMPGTAQQKLPQAVSPARLEAHVRMLAEVLVPRDWQHPENLDRTAVYIREACVKAGARVSEQVYSFNGKTYRNVIAQFGPESSESVIVGAHYDAAGPFPGADDNASGVAGLLELAWLLGDTVLPQRVELVAYTLEESVHFGAQTMGSAVHAGALKEQGVGVRAMLSLEMIGYFNDAPQSQTFPLAVLKLLYPDRGNFIAVVGRLGEGALARKIKGAMRAATTLPVHSINAPRRIPGVDFSDHRSYWDLGYPAAMITDTAFYRNPNYHTAQDTPDTLDYGRMAQAVVGVYAAVLALAR